MDVGIECCELVNRQEYHSPKVVTSNGTIHLVKLNKEPVRS